MGFTWHEKFGIYRCARVEALGETSERALVSRDSVVSGFRVKVLPAEQQQYSCRLCWNSI